MQTKMLKYKDLANALRSEIDLKVDWGMHGTITLHFNNKIVYLPVYLSDAQTIENMCDLWETILDVLTAQFRDSIFAFIRQNKPSFN